MRSKTADSHQKLEELPVSKSITSPTITKADYADYLALMADMIYDTEQRIFPMLTGIIDDIGNRKKSGWLQQDLHYLGIKKTNFEPVFNNAPESVAFALGMMYVVEGSVLGGRFILKNINENLGLEEQGTQYFSGYGNKTGSYWKQFLNAMIAYKQQHDCAEDIIAGAEYGFRAIHHHLKKRSGK